MTTRVRWALTGLLASAATAAVLAGPVLYAGISLNGID